MARDLNEREGVIMKKGLIQVYTGEGKGKTTAAFGLAVRATGRGFNVVVIQFFKADETGEVLLLKNKVPEMEIYAASTQTKFSWGMDKSEIDLLKEETTAGYKQAEDIIKNNKCDVLVLDEITYALQQRFIDIKACAALLENKPETMEIILTGRDAPAEIIKIADLVTEMKKIKHPFDAGVGARIGIEK